MKIDNGHFYNTEPVIDLDHFVELLLVSLANKENYPKFNENSSIRIAELPLNYKEQIEEAMFSDSDKIKDFLQLIDSYQYYEHQSKWEMSLADSFKRYLQSHNKSAEYNFHFDYIEIKYTTEEVERILSEYDEKVKEIMESFIFYIHLPYFKRYDFLLDRETKRSIDRQYIRTGPYTYSNTYQEHRNNR